MRGSVSIGELLNLIDQKRFAKVREILLDENVVHIAEFLTELDQDARSLLIFRLLPKGLAAEVFAYLEHDLQQRIVEGISDRELASILDELFLDDTVDFIEEMPASIVKRVIKMSDADTRRQINQLLMYPDASAGSIMTIELMQVDSDWRVDYAIRQVRQQAEDKESISTLFVTDDQRHLKGSIMLRDLLVAKDDALISDILEREAISVNTHDNQEEVADKFKRYDLETIPVVDNENRLVGLITIDDIFDVIEEETTEDIYKMAAMEPIEQSYMDAGVLLLAKNRIPWLMILMVSATFTGIIIGKYNDVLYSNILLSSFIPMLMDTSGNAGSQTSVSVIRALVLGEIEFTDIWKVMWKEVRVGVLAGAVISVFNFFRILLINQQPIVAMVVAFTIFFAVVASKLVGCALPMIATKLKLDPALMASPMITTIVDAMSLLVYFNFAAMMLPNLA